MRLGFTGTRGGTTNAQKEAFRHAAKMLRLQANNLRVKIGESWRTAYERP